MVYLLHSVHRMDYNWQSQDLWGKINLHGEIMILSPTPPSSLPRCVAVCLRGGETPTNKHAVYQWTISPGANVGPAMAHVVKRRALRETTRWWRDEGERRARCLRGVCVCGGRAACGRHACARSELLGVFSVVRLSLWSRRTKMTAGGATSFPRFQRNLKFRSPIRLSCNAKASDAAETQLLVPPLALPRASLCWAACQLGPVPVAFATTREPSLFALPNETTKQQICIYRNRCCNRFDSHWPRLCQRGEKKPEGGRGGGEKEKFMTNSCLEVFRL